MDKLKLTAKEKIIFREALNEARKGGEQNATFLASSMYELVEGSEKILKTVMDRYCEIEDAKEESDKQAMQKASRRYAEPGDGHDEFS